MEKNTEVPSGPAGSARSGFCPTRVLAIGKRPAGAPECQRRRHAIKCAQWNRKNRPYFQEIYLRRRLESVKSDPPDPLRSSSFPVAPTPFKTPFPSNDLRDVVQEVIGAQQLVIIEYFVRLLARGVQETIRAQLPETQRESSRLPSSAISRGDGQREPPQGSLSP